MARLLPAVLLLPLLVVVVAGGAAAKEPGKNKGDVRPGVPDQELQKSIDQAISRGAAWLKTQQKVNGSLGGIVSQGDLHHELGTSALCGLALLAAGVPPDDPVFETADPDTKEPMGLLPYLKTNDELRGQAGSRSTYDTGVLLMFLTRYYRGEEVKKPRKGRTRPGGQRNPCNLPSHAKRWIQDLVNWLIRVQKRETATWGYPAHRDDLSNTQYAFLGLRAARDCGARVPAAVFLQGAKTALERQEEDGPEMKRIVDSGDPDKPYVMDMGDRARGWKYLLGDEYTGSGSMTTAGIAILAICNDALLRPKRVAAYTGQLEREVQRSVQDGFSWLDLHFALDKNPGPGNVPNWHYYYLYGLERAGVLGGRDLIGKHDWYIEGAKYLIRKQASDGRWSTGMLGEGTYEASDPLDTAWAVLFLSRATRPAPPVPAPVITEGD